MFLSRYHHVYFDNYFASVKLLLDLSKDRLYGCGTLRSNHIGFPSDLQPHLKKGFSTKGYVLVRQFKETKGEGWVRNRKQSNRLAVSIWQDNWPVVVISSTCDPTESTRVQCHQRDSTYISILCPLSVYLYNRYTGGVNHNDQMRGY